VALGPHDDASVASLVQLLRTRSAHDESSCGEVGCGDDLEEILPCQPVLIEAGRDVALDSTRGNK
jgi:hypothetical protein